MTIKLYPDERLDDLQRSGYHIIQNPKKFCFLTALNITINSVKLTWKKTTRADVYQIYRYNSTKKKWEKVTTIKKGTTVTYTNKKLK